MFDTHRVKKWVKSSNNLASARKTELDSLVLVGRFPQEVFGLRGKRNFSKDVCLSVSATSLGRIADPRPASIEENWLGILSHSSAQPHFAGGCDEDLVLDQVACDGLPHIQAHRSCGCLVLLIKLLLRERWRGKISSCCVLSLRRRVPC